MCGCWSSSVRATVLLCRSYSRCSWQVLQSPAAASVKLCEQGDVRLASQLMARPYRVRGIVTHGAQRGREIGFPTANLAGIDTLVPGAGVYAGVAHYGGQAYAAAINVGPSPTFDEHADRIEVHLLDFDQSVYGEVLEVDFVARLRDIQTFSGVEALREQLMQDAVRVRKIYQNRPAG